MKRIRAGEFDRLQPLHNRLEARLDRLEVCAQFQQDRRLRLNALFEVVEAIEQVFVFTHCSGLAAA